MSDLSGWRWGMGTVLEDADGSIGSNCSEEKWKRVSRVLMKGALEEENG